MPFRLLILCLAMQNLGFQQMAPPSYPNLIVFNLILVMLVFPLLLFVSKQPQDKNVAEDGFVVPWSPWVQFVAVFVDFNVAVPLMAMVWQEVCLWLALGELKVFQNA